MTFYLFFMDFIGKDKLFGFSFCEIKNWEAEWFRSLLSIYYDNGLLRICILFFNFEFLLKEL